MDFSKLISDNKDKLIKTSLSVLSGVTLAFVINQFKSSDKQQLKSLQMTYQPSSRLNQDDDQQVEDYRTNLRMIAKNANELTQNSLFQELRELENDMCEIMRVDHQAWNLQIEQFPNIQSPLLGDSQLRSVLGGEGFLPEDAFIFKNSFVLSHAGFGPEMSVDQAKKWLRAGPRKNIFHQSNDVKALVVTSYGICPGTNTFIRELVMCLKYNYNVDQIYGSQHGFSGLLEQDGHKLVQLTPKLVKTIQQYGGSILGTSKKVQQICNVKLIVDKLEKNGFNQVYLLGNFYMFPLFQEIYQEILSRKLHISVCGIPKTVDRQFPLVDTGFGFESANEEACRIIKAAQICAVQNQYGLSVVRVIGKNAGWSCMSAGLTIGNVDICLVPEMNFNLNGPNGVLEHIAHLAQQKKHISIVVSEGAGRAMSDEQLPVELQDDFGNFDRFDFGEFLALKAKQYVQQVKKIDLDVKYIDARNIMIAVPSNPLDNKIATILAQNSAHGMMAGFTNFTIANINNDSTYINIKELLKGKYPTQIQPDDRTWQRLLAKTCQPNFLNKN